MNRECGGKCLVCIYDFACLFINTPPPSTSHLFLFIHPHSSPFSHTHTPYSLSIIHTYP
ncbi:hypothetical protein Hanom_Chr06g00484281 [Helianthus anomalus]